MLAVPSRAVSGGANRLTVNEGEAPVLHGPDVDQAPDQPVACAARPDSDLRPPEPWAQGSNAKPARLWLRSSWRCLI